MKQFKLAILTLSTFFLAYTLINLINIYSYKNNKQKTKNEENSILRNELWEQMNENLFFKRS